MTKEERRLWIGAIWDHRAKLAKKPNNYAHTSLFLCILATIALLLNREGPEELVMRHDSFCADVAWRNWQEYSCMEYGRGFRWDALFIHKESLRYVIIHEDSL